MNFLAFLPFIISFLIGYFIYSNLTLRSDIKNKFALGLILSFGLGLAISSFLTFSSFIFLNKFHKFFVIFANILTLFIAILLFFIRLKKHNITWRPFPKLTVLDIILFILFLILSIPAFYWGSFFLHGGWDAWSTWNLKAKMLYLGGENWKNIFSPVLWRASPHYPLLLPLINVWGWSFLSEALPVVPLMTAIIFMLLTVSLVYEGLKYITHSRWSYICVPLLLLHSYYMRISMSQYCDIVLGFYLLAGIICLILSREENLKTFALLAGLNLGILTFTKPEGTVAAGILVLFSLPHLFQSKAASWKIKILFWLHMLYGFLIGFIPTLIFQFFYSPGNQTMINGLISNESPSTWQRFDIIWKFYLIEMAGDYSPWNGLWIGSWHGIWIALLIGLVVVLLKKPHGFDPFIRIIPFFILGYMSVITFYYFVNTYFPIAWWMQVTLHRIYFSLLPIIIFWIFSSIWSSNPKTKK